MVSLVGPDRYRTRTFSECPHSRLPVLVDEVIEIVGVEQNSATNPYACHPPFGA
ncbi:MAG TPA: hypothetical protein VFV02_06615 [Acidimicrobiales bacterium]|nr:hypothetical protein [Acidimicrobiales bacterium]